MAITVPNVAKAVEWYTSRFNCCVDYIDESWALLGFANTKLALVLPQEHPSHFALSRPDANKFGDLVTHRDGLNSVYITDAFGNSIEVSEEHNVPDVHRENLVFIHHYSGTHHNLVWFPTPII